MIPKEKMVEIAKTVFNTVTIEDIKVLKDTNDSITVFVWPWHIFMFSIIIIFQFFASSLMPHVIQKFSVDQLMEIGLPLALVHYRYHYQQYHYHPLHQLIKIGLSFAWVINHHHHHHYLNPNLSSNMFSSSSSSTLVIVTFRKEFPKEKMGEIVKAVLNKLTVEEIKVFEKHRLSQWQSWQTTN